MGKIVASFKFGYAETISRPLCTARNGRTAHMHCYGRGARKVTEFNRQADVLCHT